MSRMQCQHCKLQQLYKMVDEGTSANVAGHGNLNSFENMYCLSPANVSVRILASKEACT